MTGTSSLAAPFPWFGGKSRIAAAVWQCLGNPDNYVEPFAGSLAVLLARPHAPRIETVNDLDGFLVNFWRAVATDPEAVAHHADWPVSEADLHARHAYLVRRTPWLTERLCGDPSFCDPKLAGWWVWGQCSWIGAGWCSGNGPWRESGGMLLRGDAGQGIHRKLPHLGDAGRGINRQLPHLGDAGRGMSEQGAAVLAWMTRLQRRLRAVRMTCGDWRRVLTPVVTHRHGTTAIFLDPPYAEGETEYAVGDTAGVATAVSAWCREHGAHPKLRIALCGHEGEHNLPGWTALAWSGRGGYGNQGGEDQDDNRHRETIWFSPACIGAQQGSLFAQPVETAEAAP